MARLPFPQRLPGTYFHIESEVRPMAAPGSRGIVMAMLPLPWGGTDGVIDMHVREFLSNQALAKIGMTAFDFEQNKQVAALMSGAVMGKIFRQNVGGDKAAGVLGDIVFTAKHFGTAGNEITVNIILQNERYTVTTFFRGSPMHVQSVAELEQLVGNDFVDIDFSDADEVTLGEIMLEGGTDGVVPDYASRLQAFLDAAALESWHTIALSIAAEDTGYTQARSTFKAWLAQLNEDEQQLRQGVVVGDGMDSEMIIGIHQTAKLDGEQLNLAEMTLYRAGHTAGSAINESETNKIMRGLTDVKPLLNRRQREDADSRGLFTYVQNWDGRFKVERDINSFVSVKPRKNIQWRDNRIMRALHDAKVQIARTFDSGFKGRETNDEHGRVLLLGEIHNLFTGYEERRVMENHDISKLRVFPGEGGPNVVGFEARNIQFVTAMDTLDFDMTITW